MFGREYEELARKQSKYIDKVIANKLQMLEAEIRLRDFNGIHTAFVHRLNRLNNEGYNYNTMSRFIVDIGKIGYTLSLDYLPDYSRVEYKDGGATIKIDPSKIEITVTYKVISI